MTTSPTKLWYQCKHEAALDIGKSDEGNELSWCPDCDAYVEFSEVAGPGMPVRSGMPIILKGNRSAYVRPLAGDTDFNPGIPA